MTVRSLAAVVCLCAPLIAQHRVDPRNMYERALCIVPIVGAGTPDDPRRPEFAPLPTRVGTAASGDGIIAFSFQASDDGKFALVEFVARTREAFAPILADKRPEVKVFIKGKDKRQDIEAAFRKLKTTFNLDTFGTVAP